MKTITIINAYGNKNYGDLTILNMAIMFIKNSIPDANTINILRENEQELTKNTTTYLHPYGYAIRSQKKKAPYTVKIFKFLNIYSRSFLIVLMDRLSVKNPPKHGVFSYISAIKSADLIVGMGGGYFVSKHAFKDLFGLGLSLIPIYVAKLYKKNILFLPISLGPFGSKFHEEMVINALKNSTVIARDLLTLRKIKKLDAKNQINTFYSPDLAIFFNNSIYNRKDKIKSNYIILTALDWLPENKQENYESCLVNLIDYIYEKYKLKTVFIPMAFNEIEDDDNIVGKRIKYKIQNKKAFSIAQPKDLKELQTIIGQSRLGVLTRMHSAILSTTVCSPYIPIGYGIKMLGFVKSYGLEKWYIDMKDITIKLLKERFDLLLEEKNYNNFLNEMMNNHKEKLEYRSTIIDTLRNSVRK